MAVVTVYARVTGLVCIGAFLSRAEVSWDHATVSSAGSSLATATAAQDAPAQRTGFSPQEVVVGVAAVLVAAHVALRAWMLWPSWFYGDDYALIGEAQASGLSVDYLVEPYGGRFQPLGRLLVWIVADAGPLDWHTAAVILIVMVALADVACVWMLLELFGARPGVLLPLAAYLGSAVVMPGTMWFAAALDQLPLQAVLCAAVAAWVRYLRTGRARWWVVTVVVMGLGLLAFVKTLLVLIVLGWLTVAHYSSGGPLRRVGTVLRRYAAGCAVLVGGALAFLVWYLNAVPSLVTEETDNPVAADLARAMLGQALPVGLLGGPWRWGTTNLPVALADPPQAAVVLAWVVLAATAAGLALRRRRTGRVWVLLGLYAGAAYLLLLVTRAPLVGGRLGLEYRYLTDVVPVAALCLGLATMTLRGADEPTETRVRPRLRLPASLLARLPALAAVALAASGLVSSIAYGRLWHTDHSAHEWFQQVKADLSGHGAVDVAEGSVPEPVVSGLVSPWNTLSRLLPQAGLPASFPEVSTRLAHVDEDGHVTQGFVAPAVLGVPGPEDECGHRLGAGGPSTVTIPLEQEVPAGIYWMRIPYLASAADSLQVRAGESSGEAQVSKGLGNIFVDLATGADGVTLSIDGDAVVCLGRLEAGPLLEGPPW